MYFLAVNCGSSSIKVSLVNPVTNEIYFDDKVERLEKNQSSEIYEKSLALLIDKMMQIGIIKSLDQVNFVCHRVVHGGEKYERPALINRRVKTDIKNLSDLAPLHNPYNLEGINAAEKLVKCPHYAIFDTAFHSTIPEENYLYALPYYLYKKHAVRKYGFHGISHNYIANKTIEILKNKRVRFISCHLGSGCSLTAIANGQSLDCSMGFTPLEGVPMSTRSGSIDAAIIFYLQRKLKMPIAEIEDMLFHKSGLLGLSEYASDMRDLLKPNRSEKVAAERAVNFFVLKVARMIFSQFAVLGKLDAIVFTAGMGEDSAEIRRRICEHLAPLGVKLDEARNEFNSLQISSKSSLIKVLVIPTNESMQMAKSTYEYVK